MIHVLGDQHHILSSYRTWTSDAETVSFEHPIDTHHNPISILKIQNTSTDATDLTIEFKLIRLIATLDLATVRVFQIGLNNIVPILPHCSQPSLLHDCSDDGS